MTHRTAPAMRPHLVPLILLFLAAAMLASCASGPPGADGAEDAIPVRVEGNEAVSAGDLFDAAIRQLRSFQRDGHKRAESADAADAMQRWLWAQGYAHAKVESELVPSEEDVQELVFKVKEGPRLVFEGVTFEGNSVVRSRQLETFFDFRASGLFGTGPVLYDRGRVESAMSEVESLYLLRGYHRVKVGPLDVDERDDGQVHVTVPIEEGPLYTVGDVTIEMKDHEELKPRLDELVNARGKPFHVRVPAEIAAEIRTLLLEQARQLADVQSAFQVDDEQHTAAITITVAPGPALVLRNLAVEGEDRTAGGFIEDQADLQPGKKLTKTRLDEALNRLYSTGLFGLVRIRQDPVGTDGDVRETDVTIEIEELPARSVEFEVGWGSYELARGAVTYNDRNLFGAGRDLEAGVHGSLRGFGSDVRLQDRYLLGRSNTLEAAASFDLREEPSFDRTATRLLLSYRHDFDSDTMVQTGYRFDAVEASNIQAEIPESELRGFSLTSGIFANFRDDTRNDVLAPSSGWIADFGTFWSTPVLGADLDFVELSGSFATYVGLDEDADTVLAFGTSFRTRHILDDRMSLPIQERLFVGGESSVRSFYQDELGPTDADGDPLGGLTAFEGHVEVRRRLIENLHLAIFYDVGTVGEDSFDVAGPFGHAVGIGLRYYLPVGPVRLDFGYNPGPRFAADQDWAIHFSFGFSF